MFSCFCKSEIVFVTFSVPLISFPGATNETLLQKFHNEHKESEFYKVPPQRDHGFIIKHYAGKVKYSVKVCMTMVIIKKRK